MSSVDFSRKDYQQFRITDGCLQDPGARMQQKSRAMADVWPGTLKGKTVLDVGCDHGYWSLKAAEEGAARVLGVDRSRVIRGDSERTDIPQEAGRAAEALDAGDVCSFIPFEAGAQFHDLGRFDVVLCMSLYHHMYANTGGNHESLWYWLWRATKEVLIWENPINTEDPVAQVTIHRVLHPNYTEEVIRASAEKYFDIEYEGLAIHEEHREVWKLVPRARDSVSARGRVIEGAGGATKAFEHESSRRVNELQYVLNERVIPGSLNVMVETPFHWDSAYYRTLILDVVDRKKGLTSEWRHRPCRLYPVYVDGAEGWVMRFEGEHYTGNFLEIIGVTRFRDSVGEIVTVTDR